VIVTLAELVDRARQLQPGTRRRVIGVVGSPGAGKTTLVEAMLDALVPAVGLPDGWVAHVPMDGFHLADVELSRLGRLDRKGAPDTFDAAGYAALLHRIRAVHGTPETVYAPGFDRDLEQPLAGAIAVLPQCRLVLTEGNYLLLENDAWPRVREQLDEVWFLDADDEVRRSRLVRRHVRFGKAPADAEAWVAQVDEPNARLVESTRDLADLVVAASVLAT
jgi:pantothenate kinase